MNKEEITCKIPNNQIHISKEKDEDCLIWISSKAINMSNTIDELQQQVKMQKEVIDKAIEYMLKETKSMPVNGCTIRLKELLDILKEVE